MENKTIMKKDNDILVEVISGKEGQCLSVNNMRVCGSKPWGGGTVMQTWKMKRSDIIKALRIIEAEDFYDHCNDANTIDLPLKLKK